MKKYKLYYGTEENGFESEKFGEFKTASEAIKDMKEHIKENGIYDNGELPDVKESDVKDYFDYQLLNANGYEVIYIITTDGRSARSTLAQLRRMMMDY